MGENVTNRTLSQKCYREKEINIFSAFRCRSDGHWENAHLEMNCSVWGQNWDNAHKKLSWGWCISWEERTKSRTVDYWELCPASAQLTSGLMRREMRECIFAFLLQNGYVQNSSFNPGTSKVLNAWLGNLSYSCLMYLLLFFFFFCISLHKHMR